MNTYLNINTIKDGAIPLSKLKEIPSGGSSGGNSIYSEISHGTTAEVNEFMVGDIPIWLDKSTRAGLMLRFQSEKNNGKRNNYFVV